VGRVSLPCFHYAINKAERYNETNALLEWIRLPGDVVFIVGGVLPLLYLCYLGVRHTVPLVTMEEPEEILFTEIAEPEPAEPRGR
jgi:nitric oxide reductase subunit B